MTDSCESAHERWARFRFSVVGPLLSAPPRQGELHRALRALSRKVWQHPIRQGDSIRLGFSTIERWFHVARKSPNPIEALRRAVRDDAGTFRVFTDLFVGVLLAQYRKHPHWSYQLHHDNLVVVVERDSSRGPLPSYPSLVRFMKVKDMRRRKRRGNEKRSGLAEAEKSLEEREVRSFEVDHVAALWHLDFHESRYVRVLLPDGRRIKPRLLAVMDDHSRLGCHAQFYLEETTETLVHAFCQALLKRGLPRALLTDNGGPMISAEFAGGLAARSIQHHTTLPNSPHQNGKQEHFFDVVEGRFLAMLDHVPDLTLERLNTLLQAWVEVEYNRSKNDETDQTPLERFLEGPDVSRPAPTPQDLREGFRRQVRRRIRRSDATLTIEAVRFEVPYALRHLDRVRVAYARWDLGFVHLLDPRTGKPLVRIFPLDRSKNASGERRRIEPASTIEPAPASSELPPLLERLLEEYMASGLAPAYLPKNASKEKTEDQSNPDPEEDSR